MRNPATPRSRARRPTNVTLPSDLVDEARALNVNLSQVCESGLVQSIAAARRTRWLEENKEAIDVYNERIERDGPILAQYCRF
jgi:antitoxin CcdA